MMRPQSFLIVFGALLMSACGTTEKTTVVAPPGSTVVAPPDSGAQVITPH